MASVDREADLVTLDRWGRRSHFLAVRLARWVVPYSSPSIPDHVGWHPGEAILILIGDDLRQYREARAVFRVPLQKQDGPSRLRTGPRIGILLEHLTRRIPVLKEAKVPGEDLESNMAQLGT